MNMARISVICWLLAAQAAGCTYDPYGYRSLSLDESVAIVEAGRPVAGSMSAACVVRIKDVDGRRATLDGAMAAGPEAFRLQAWRGQRTILDITARSDGVWLGGEAAGEINNDGSTALPDDIAARVWDAMTGRSLTSGSGAWSIVNNDEIVYRAADSTTMGGAAVIVDRATLHPARWLFELPSGKEVEIHLADYRLIDGEAWPHRVDIRSPGRWIDLRLRDVAVNEPLPPVTFQPPRGAVRMQQP